jgi:very-short-patch-repair endonuclease
VKYRPSIGSTQRARSLRLNATRAERAMWSLLREAFSEVRFRRQVPLRHYIVDFASHRARLVIECDGGQHNEKADAARTRQIEAEGYRVLRFWNSDILANPDGVHSATANALPESHPHPTSPIKGEE